MYPPPAIGSLGVDGQPPANEPRLPVSLSEPGSDLARQAAVALEFDLVPALQGWGAHEIHKGLSVAAQAVEQSAWHH